MTSATAESSSITMALSLITEFVDSEAPSEFEVFIDTPKPPTFDPRTVADSLWRAHEAHDYTHHSTNLICYQQKVP